MPCNEIEDRIPSMNMLFDSLKTHEKTKSQSPPRLRLNIGSDSHAEEAEPARRFTFANRKKNNCTTLFEEAESNEYLFPVADDAQSEEYLVPGRLLRTATAPFG